MLYIVARLYVLRYHGFAMANSGSVAFFLYNNRACVFVENIRLLIWMYTNFRVDVHLFFHYSVLILIEVYLGWGMQVCFFIYVDMFVLTYRCL